VHVGSTVALQNTIYNDVLNVSTYSVDNFQALTRIRTKLITLAEKVNTRYSLPYLAQCKSAIFLLEADAVSTIAEEMHALPFVASIVDRAVNEASIYVANGFRMLSVENFGAPYFMGTEVPIEELLILHLAAQAIRTKFPDIPLGIHVLSSDELESLPIAIASGACFIRSEATIFSGFRPEGHTHNSGTLAKLFYLRNFFHTFLGEENPQHRRFPQIWSDIQKKHTVFPQELTDISLWLKNILFMKLEGIILTGTETGKDVSEQDLALGREAVTALAQQTEKYFGTPIHIPLITGSGMNRDLYKKYADFTITGTQLKKNKYWENEVSEEYVREVVEKFA